jgi:topoisomerase-4 subunit A
MHDGLTQLTEELDPNSTLAHYAQRAYLEYALSVVKGRALPDVCDGQKPVQRRILYAMNKMGLGASSTGLAKPVKSARVVGDVLGRFHPHGDQAAYEALVRMAQDFSLRYPLIDGQGNFGSRDGDGAAAMRYTEARLAPISQLLMDEIEGGTVDFIPNYDGSTEEPTRLPARLPILLLNGASGIAVGLATEIPSHNLQEVAHACLALIEHPDLTESELHQHLPGPDYPGGGQLISHATEIEQAYRTGRASLKVRARWIVEPMARGQWQLVITELPPGVSSQKVLQEIEELTNPKPKLGKKTVSPQQLQLKANLLAVLDSVRDESSQAASVRLVFEPKNSRLTVDELSTVLLAHTSLETSVSVNLTVVGLDGKPQQKSLKMLLQEWLVFREQTVQRRSQYRLDKVKARIHILQGRQLILLHIDEVIALIRGSDAPKNDLVTHFGLSLIQAEDILEIRLRQLARLEGLLIEQELIKLQKEEAHLLRLVTDRPFLLAQMAQEIRQDARQFGDPRRTLIAPDERTAITLKVIDEAVTVIVSQKGWLRIRHGHDIDPQSLSFKVGDGLWGIWPCRSVDTLLAWNEKGRVYSLSVASLPSGRGDGQPLTSLIELETGSRIQHYLAAPATSAVLLATTGGYGFIATVAQMSSRLKAGKAFVALPEGECLCKPGVIPPQASHISVLSQEGRLLSFEIQQLKPLPSGGRGLLLMRLDDKDQLLSAIAHTANATLQIEGHGRTNKPKTERLNARSWSQAVGARARKGKPVPWSFTPTGMSVELVETTPLLISSPSDELF